MEVFFMEANKLCEHEHKYPTKTTVKGIAYCIPNGIEEDIFYNLIYEFIDLAKVKGITIRQAQYLFNACADYVLESKLV